MGLVLCYHGGVHGLEKLVTRSYFSIRCLSDGYILLGEWRLSYSDLHLNYSQTAVADSYTSCANSGRESPTLFNLHLPYEEMHDRQGRKHTYKGKKIGWREIVTDGLRGVVLNISKLLWDAQRKKQWTTVSHVRIRMSDGIRRAGAIC